MVRTGASVLDLGCGDGTLLSHLVLEKGVRAQGLEQDEKSIYQCVAKGLSVFHGDIDTGLSEYGDRSFDYVIFDQSLQQVRQPDRALGEALRVGREVIVAFPNFAFWPSRLQICLRGRTPVTPSLPYSWYDSPNLHFLSVADFTGYCRKRGIPIRNSIALGRERVVRVLPNLLGETGIFLIARVDARAA
ncbi:MAG: methionine biosynthesis protein MetW [Nitrospirae bacterium]|nr:methionine biosynthesis protein MetW [Nitrospirota bacterium]NTW65342.1 methionine biosynthesis protein MetW [Nitrospirota bacterium]